MTSKEAILDRLNRVSFHLVYTIQTRNHIDVIHTEDGVDVASLYVAKGQYDFYPAANDDVRGVLAYAEGWEKTYISQTTAPDPKTRILAPASRRRHRFDNVGEKVLLDNTKAKKWHGQRGTITALRCYCVIIRLEDGTIVRSNSSCYTVEG